MCGWVYVVLFAVLSGWRVGCGVCVFVGVFFVVCCVFFVLLSGDV